MILLLQSFDYWFIPLIKRKSMSLHLSYTCLLTMIQILHYFYHFLYLLLHTSPILSYLQSYLSFIYTLQFFGSCYFYYRFLIYSSFPPLLFRLYCYARTVIQNAFIPLGRILFGKYLSDQFNCRANMDKILCKRVK